MEEANEVNTRFFELTEEQIEEAVSIAKAFKYIEMEENKNGSCIFNTLSKM